MSSRQHAKAWRQECPNLKHRTESQIPWLPALLTDCVNDVIQRAVIAPPPESPSRRAFLNRLALLVGGSMLMSEPVAFARDTNKLSFADQRSNMHEMPQAHPESLPQLPHRAAGRRRHWYWSHRRASRTPLVVSSDQRGQIGQVTTAHS
jgi:hypothetical protein